MEMTVKQITSKINSTEKKIDECTAIINRNHKWINEAESTDKGWMKESIPLYKRSIKDNEKKLNKYVAQLAEYKGMLEGRVKEYPVVREYVNAWKKACIEYITNPTTIESNLKARADMKEEIKKMEKEYKEKKLPSYQSYNKRCLIEKKFNREWGFVYTYFNCHDNAIDTKRLEKDYEYEATRKYNKFIEDCEFYVGEILDVSNLSVGNKGDLNGFVVGTKGKAEVETISACGEVQRFHYRTLFKMVK